MTRTCAWSALWVLYSYELIRRGEFVFEKKIEGKELVKNEG